MLADDKDTLYVSFMGTKQRRDLVTNAAVLQEPLWSSLGLETNDQKAGVRSISPFSPSPISNVPVTHYGLF